MDTILLKCKIFRRNGGGSVNQEELSLQKGREDGMIY